MIQPDMDELIDEAIVYLEGWANAYPLSVFPEPDLERAHEALQAVGMTLDSVSASMGRELAGAIAKRIIPVLELAKDAIPVSAE